MKKYHFLLIIVLAVLGSCSEMLDLQNDGRISMDEVFTTRNGVRGYLSSCYQYRPIAYVERSSLCDETHDSDGTFANSLYSFWYGNALSSMNYGSVDGQPWQNYYMAIRRCNVFIDNMNRMTPGVISASEGELTGWVAQARTLRALYYLNLIKRYGAVPLITEPYATTHDYSADRRTPVSEVVTQILQDCDDALAAPDIESGFSWTVYTSQSGIMTRAVAHAIKSEAITYACSPLFADGTYTWADATRINATALYECTTHGYELFRTVPEEEFAQNTYAAYFLTHPDEQRAADKESIWGYRGVNIWQQSGMPSTAGQFKAGTCPTQEMVDSYEMANGEPPISGYSDAQHLNPVINPASGYNASDPYANRDPRFYASIYYTGAQRTFGSAPIRDDHIPMTLVTDAGTNLMTATEDNGEYHIQTTGGDPFILTAPLAAALGAPPPSVILRFQYKSAKRITNVQFFFARPNPEGGISTDANLIFQQASEWTEFELDITSYCQSFGWGETGHRLRFDTGSQEGEDIYIRNIEIVIYAPPAEASMVETFVGAVDGISTADRRTTHTGYYLRKFNNWKSNRDNDADGAMRIFRLAELYLNFAESAYQSNGPDVAVQLGGAVSMSARDAVNVIRDRAGMPPFPSGMSPGDFEKKYRNERRIELAFEDHRYFDVRRWKILEETERYVTGMRITQEGNSLNYTRIVFERGSWLEKYYFNPIPQSEVNKMQSHTGINWQNPGW